METAVALIDGEHYLPVIEDALARIQDERHLQLLAAVFIGGREKITEDGLPALDYPLVAETTPEAGVLEAIKRFRPAWLVDLSDEPVVGYKERFALASLALAEGVSYLGADFCFEAPRFQDIMHKPSLSIIGTGKRVGKTAISSYVSRHLGHRGFVPVVVAMGRGGPEAPEVLDGSAAQLTPEVLLEASKKGKHAASDYYEDALITGLTTVGCRRCGGGMAGAPFFSNVIAGANVANELDGDLVIFEGSGAALPPIRTDASILTVAANQPLEYIVGYFGHYRLLLADLVVITMCEPIFVERGWVEKIEEEIKRVNSKVQVVHTRFRPVPLRDIGDQRVFLATTAPLGRGSSIKKHLEERYDCQVVGVSHHLADRRLLRKDLTAAPAADVFLTELKAAGVDVVTEFGLDSGAKVVYLDNRPETVGGDGELEDLALALARRATREFSAHGTRQAQRDQA